MFLTCAVSVALLVHCCFFLAFFNTVFTILSFCLYFFFLNWLSADAVLCNSTLAVIDKHIL